jgi:hypothetical protein
MPGTAASFTLSRYESVATIRRVPSSRETSVGVELNGGLGISGRKLREVACRQRANGKRRALRGDLHDALVGCRLDRDAITVGDAHYVQQQPGGKQQRAFLLDVSGHARLQRDLGIGCRQGDRITCGPQHDSAQSGDRRACRGSTGDELELGKKRLPFD